MLVYILQEHMTDILMGSVHVLQTLKIIALCHVNIGKALYIPDLTRYKLNTK